MKTLVLSLLFLAAVAPLPAADPTADIKALLSAQQAAWNRGDLDAFMDGYVRSDDLRFASDGEITYGWRTTLRHYQERYPDRATMGRLRLHGIVVTVLAHDAAIAFGHWELARESDRPHGLFTLTLKRTDDGWRIFQYHTSSASAPDRD